MSQVSDSTTFLRNNVEHTILKFTREYARHALLGIATPQSNPVVEAEFSVLRPDGVGAIITRLTGTAEDPQHRFHQFLENLERSVSYFGESRLDAFGFACTATAYSFGNDEAIALEATSARLDAPAISSAAAIRRALALLGVRRIALFSPYPDWLTEVSRAYWTSHGYDIVSWARMPDDTFDTVKIYGLTTEGLLAAATDLKVDDADIILITGTGMATLPAIRPLFERVRKPVLSSNICLAWALLDELGLTYLAPPEEPWETLVGGWSSRLDRL